MDKYICDVIIITVCVLFIIYLYHTIQQKNIYNKINGMQDIPRYNNKYTKTRSLNKTNKQWYNVVNKLVTNDDDDVPDNKVIFDDIYNPNIRQSTRINIDRKLKQRNKKNLGKFDAKDYIRDKVLNNNIQFCVSDKQNSKFTHNDIDKYRDSQLRFQGEMINGSSVPAIDPVDKINIINMEGGIQGNNITIADFYDNLVNNNQ